MKRDAMAYTLGEATKATGISKTSLHRAIKSGRISATKNDVGAWEIDPAELHRVFPPAANRNSSETGNLARDGTAGLQRELELLREERERERHQFEREIARLEQQLCASEQERRDKDRQLTALLTDQRAKAPDVMVTPPPTSEAIITPPSPAADPASTAIPPTAPATPPTRPHAAPVAVKVRPVKKPPAKETGWLRRIMGGR